MTEFASLPGYFEKLLGLRRVIRCSQFQQATARSRHKCESLRKRFTAFDGGNQKSACKVASAFEDRLPAHKTPYLLLCALLLQLRLPSPFCFCAVHISRHVRQRCQGPFRLRKGCQGHDGRQEGRQEKACVTVRSCRAAVPCRKDSQTFEGKRPPIQWKS